MKRIDSFRPARRGFRGCRGFRGYLLIELLAVVVLIGSFAALAGETFVTVTSVTCDSERAQSTAHRLDAAIRDLRADVWHTTAIQTPDHSTAILETPGDVRVTWSIARDGTISRRVARSGGAAGEANTWDRIGVPLQFATRDGTLVVSAARQDSSISDELVLVSQVNLAAGRRP